MSGCTICFSDIASNPYTLPCSHTFCTDCIMIWFRAGHNECPLCRDPSTVRNSWIDATKRAQAIIKRARCKRASARLKKKVATVQKRHNLYRLHCKMFAQFKRQHRNVLSTYNKMRRQLHTAHRAWNRCKNSLGFELFPHDEPLIHPFTTISPALLQ